MNTFFRKVRRLLAPALFVFTLITVDADDLAGLNVGEKAPAFALKNQDGELVSSDALLKNGPVAVVFFRSADW